MAAMPVKSRCRYRRRGSNRCSRNQRDREVRQRGWIAIVRARCNRHRRDAFGGTQRNRL